MIRIIVKRDIVKNIGSDTKGGCSKGTTDCIGHGTTDCATETTIDKTGI